MDTKNETINKVDIIGSAFIYKVHEEYIVFGKPTVFNGRINIAHPDIDAAKDLTLSTMGLQPYYITTEKMKRSGFNSHATEKLVKMHLLYWHVNSLKH